MIGLNQIEGEPTSKNPTVLTLHFTEQLRGLIVEKPPSARASFTGAFKPLHHQLIFKFWTFERLGVDVCNYFSRNSCFLSISNALSKAIVLGFSLFNRIILTRPQASPITTPSLARIATLRLICV